MQVRYKSFADFYAKNKEDFEKVQLARKELRSPQELGMSGDVFIQAEKLSYQFLNLRTLVSDLLFGVQASVLDAKHDVKKAGAIAFREAPGKQGDKKIMAECDQLVINANKSYNDLLDLKDYLNLKWQDFESCHYYYKQLNQGRS